MRRFTIIIIALACVFAGHAQKKPKINKANNAREDGDLAEAKEIIDAAIVHEKTKDDGETWYYRGLIYATIDTTSNPEHSALSDNALEEAMKAFKVADSLGEKDKDYFIRNEMGLPVTKTQQMQGYWSYYYNNGVQAFQDSKFEEAVKSFESSYYILPEDTNSYVNAAYAAHNGEMFDKAKENYRKAIDHGAADKDLYTNYINILLAADKDNETALEVVNEALEKFPGEPQLLKSKVNILIQQERITEAEDDLKQAIAAEPENVNLRFTMGILQEELGNVDAAKEAYKGALEVDPDHFESNFNLGVILINDAQEVIKEVNNLGMSKADQKKAEQMRPKIKEKLKEALPQWEKTYEVKPDDAQAKETLMYIYTQLGMDDKASALED